MSNMNLSRLSQTLLLAVLVIAPGAALAQDSDPGGAPPAPNEEPGTLDTLMDQSSLGNVSQAAMSYYHAGHRSFARAEKMESKLDETPASKREKTMAKIEKAYQDAIDSYLQAIRTNPKLLEAYTELGQSYRAVDKHAEAVQVYNAVLKMAPENVDSIYGRGEAFLALNYLREAATTYAELAEGNAEHAAKLMASMKAWVAERRENPGELRPDAVETLALWIEQQESGSS